MRYKVIVEDADSEEIVLMSTDDSKLCEGARLGAESLLNLFYDEMNLEEGYKVVVKEEGNLNSDNSYKREKSFTEMFDRD